MKNTIIVHIIKLSLLYLGNSFTNKNRSSRMIGNRNSTMIVPRVSLMHRQHRSPYDGTRTLMIEI